MIAPREVGAPDRSLEQHVAHDRQARPFVEEHHMAGRVPGRVDHPQGLLAEPDLVAVLQPAVGLEGGQCGEAEPLALFGQLVDPELVLAMRPLERHAVAARELGRLAAMIDVAVGQEDLLELGAQAREGFVDAIEITARIERGRTAGARADQQRAVLRKRGDRHQGQLQGRRRAGVVAVVGSGVVAAHAASWLSQNGSGGKSAAPGRLKADRLCPAVTARAAGRAPDRRHRSGGCAPA